MCKTAERQLPPNLKAIKYWFQSGDAETVSAQRLSKGYGISKDNGAYGANGTYEANGQKTGKNDNTSAQRLSRVSEISDLSHTSHTSHTSQSISEMLSAQVLSNSSESGGCPVYSVGAGQNSYAQGLDNNITPAQVVSNSSEMPGSAAFSDSFRSSHSSPYAARASAQRLSKMSRKERQRLLKNRLETHSLRD